MTERLCEDLSKHPLQSEKGQISLTASFGVSERIEHKANSAEALINLADTALYKAKKAGKNCVMLA